MRDFFTPPDAQCLSTSAVRMYLSDGMGTAPAILSATPQAPQQKRPVVVTNANGKTYVFRPVDKIIYGPKDPRRCDAFLHTKDRTQLIFVELKLWQHASGWIHAGLAQLKNVVDDFNISHREISEKAKIKKAYVCNPYHPSFAYSCAGAMRDFKRCTHFSLFPEGHITIV